MKTKLWCIPILVALILLFSAAVITNASREIKIPDRNALYKRVIADFIDEENIKLFESNGCLLKHKLERSASFECPDGIAPKLNARESRIFRIMDLNADKQTGADKVWAEGITGSGVNVAVLDTGIDTDHPELQDSYLGGYDYVNNDPYPEDDHGHGTHVAGIITANGINDANSKGVAPGAGIYMYKVCNANGNCYEDDMMAAMEAAVQTDAKVMSISIGGGSYTAENCDSDSLAAKVNWVAGQGLAVAVAAGNDGRGVSSPGCASGAIAVGAVDINNNVPYWSGRGKALDMIAPGVNIYSTLMSGYGKMSGTSMAAPHVSGIAALLLQTNPGLTADKIKAALFNTTNPANKCYKCTLWWGYYCLRQAEVTCTSDITGKGIVDAYKAYLVVKPAGPACSSDMECDDGNQCTNDVCVNPGETSAYCQNTALTDDGICTEGICCSGKCAAPSCTDAGNECNDGNECTADACNSPGTCSASCSYANAADNATCTSGVCCLGTCRASACSADIDCNDNSACTKDTCRNAGTCSASCSYTSIQVCINNNGCCPAGCNYTNDNDCPSVVKCWSAQYQYLYRNSNQMKKFCKCAQGIYGYSSYSYSYGRKTVYKYVDSGNNQNWEVTSTPSNYPVYRVKCTNGSWYSTNQDYYD